MTGRTFHGYRYYVVSRARSNPSSKGIYNLMVPAEPLESDIIHYVADALNLYEDFDESVKGAIADYEASLRMNSCNRASLIREQAKLLDQMEIWIRQVSDLGDDVVDTKIKPIKEKLAAIKQSLANSQAAVPMPPTQELLTGVRSICKDLGTEIKRGIPQIVPQALRIIVRKMVVDLDTRAVEVELRLPSWSILRKPPASGEFCLDNFNAHIEENEAEFSWSIRIDRIDCVHKRVGRSACWTCSRTEQRATGLKIPQEVSRKAA